MSWLRVTTRLESYLPAGLHRFHTPCQQQGVSSAAVQQACDRLAAQLNKAQLNRRDLLDIATELGFLVRQVGQLVEASVASGGRTREATIARDALGRVRQHLYWVQPYPHRCIGSPCGAAEMRAELDRAMWDTRHALIVLAWGKMCTAQ